MNSGGTESTLPWSSASDGTLTRTWRFCALQVPHVLLAPVLLFFYGTFLHELAHVAAALAQGATITSFRFIPNAYSTGLMTYEPPATGHFEGVFVSLAPYVMWSIFAMAVIAVAALPNRLHPALSSTLFIWGFAMPIGDIAWNLSGGIMGYGDLAGSGPLAPLLHGTCLLLLFVAYIVGFWVQRRLFGPDAITFAGYLVATVVLGAGFGMAGVLGYSFWEMG